MRFFFRAVRIPRFRLVCGRRPVLHVRCADEARVLELVKHMEQEGYPLPTEPPDATFIWPAWMPQPAVDER